ncbi:MAG: hypothetical protein ACJ79H_03495 [Myxococcales bacterium]
MKVAVLVPVLGRPQKAQPLVDSLAASVQAHELVPIFLCSPGDDEEIRAVVDTGADLIVMPFENGKGDYARKLNLGFRRAGELGMEWSFLAADDLRFRAGWFEAGLRTHERSGACVVGTNDLGNPRVKAGRHSTHTLVHADYSECGTVDEDDRILHEGYHHNYVDEEFIQTAMWRSTFSFARDSYVEHLHPDWRKGVMDDTYRLGKSTFEDDRRYYESRKRLWGR